MGWLKVSQALHSVSPANILGYGCPRNQWRVDSTLPANFHALVTFLILYTFYMINRKKNSKHNKNQAVKDTKIHRTNEDGEYSRYIYNRIGESSRLSNICAQAKHNLKDANISPNCCRTSRCHTKAHLSPTTALHQKVLPGHNRSAISTHQIYFLAMSDHQPVRPRVAFAVAALTKPRD